MQQSQLPRSPITAHLEQQGFVLLDGGLATELEKLGHRLDGNLWSARLLADDPRDIGKVHRSYLDAGTDCITAASYQAGVPGFTEAGFSPAEATVLLQRSVTIACETRDQYLEESTDPPGIQPLVAASIGPFGAYLADGSEYRGDYSLAAGELRAFHQSRWEILCDTPADLFAIETIPSFREAVVLRELLESTPGIHAWVGFSCPDGTNISDGTPLAQCAELFSGCDQVVAIGVNCTAPRHISSLIREIRHADPGKHVVVYPNSGERYDAEHNNWQGVTDPVGFGDCAIEWFNLGATMIGGCCRTGPGHITEMKKSLLNNLEK